MRLLYVSLGLLGGVVCLVALYVFGILAAPDTLAPAPPSD
jgi:hypothetical protein